MQDISLSDSFFLTSQEGELFFLSLLRWGETKQALISYPLTGYVRLRWSHFSFPDNISFWAPEVLSSLIQAKIWVHLKWLAPEKAKDQKSKCQALCLLGSCNIAEEEVQGTFRSWEGTGRWNEPEEEQTESWTETRRDSGPGVPSKENMSGGRKDPSTKN